MSGGGRVDRIEEPPRVRVHDHGGQRLGEGRRGHGRDDRYRRHWLCDEFCVEVDREKAGEVEMNPEIKEGMITVQDVSKSIGDLRILEDITFSVDRREFLCIVGPSGCGKTTLLKCIAGLRDYEGEILIDGLKSAGINRKIGFVFQEFSLFPFRTVKGNMEFGLEILKKPKKEREETAERLVDLFRLQGFENAYPHELSGGMQRKVAIARALATNPVILLMDEPFMSLDAQTGNMLQKELSQIWQKTMKTVIFVTHSVDEAVFLADRIIVLTKRPARIKKEIAVNLKRERDRNSPEFVMIRKEILKELEAEHAQRTHEEYQDL